LHNSEDKRIEDCRDGDFSFAMKAVDWLTGRVSDPDTLGSAPVVLELEASTEEGVIQEMIRMLADRSEVTDLKALEQAVLERQKLQPPLLGNGVALPHARTPVVTEMVMAIARCRDPVPIGPEKVPIRLIFLYGVPAHCIGEYLTAVARLTRLLRKPGILAALLAAEDEASFRELLK